MWPFTSKTSYKVSGILTGATDWHSHLLPGVDDGIQTMDETLAVLRLYAQEGVSRVWFTPHVMEDMPNTPQALREIFTQVQEAVDTAQDSSQPPFPSLHLAAENMLDSLFRERLAKGEVLPIGDDNEMLLVETSYFNPPYDLWEALGSVLSAGYYPLLAHPERYQYMSRRDYDRLADMGVRLQLNMGSLVGAYGPVAQKKAKKLLTQGRYYCMGSDTHRLLHTDTILTRSDLPTKYVDLLKNFS